MGAVVTVDPRGCQGQTAPCAQTRATLRRRVLSIRSSAAIRLRFWT